MKISVLGAAGGIGQPLSLLLKNQLPASSELSLYDPAWATPGVALDLSHIPTGVKVAGYCGSDPHEALEGADVVVIPAGVARQPGMSRDDLFITNGRIIHSLVSACAEACPEAMLLLITNPVNSTVPIAAQVLRAKGVYKPQKLLGVTTLDVIRANTLFADAMNKPPESVNLKVIGGHNGITILPLFSQVKGVSPTLMQVQSLTTWVQNAGTEVVEAKAGTGSATLSMAYAAMIATLAVVKGLQGEESSLCAFVQVSDKDDDFFAQPVRLGKSGIEEVLPYGELSDFEKERLEDLKPLLAANIAKGMSFTV